MKPKIYLSSPHMGGTEIEFVKEAFDTNWIAPLGPNVDGFEKDLENRLGENVHVAALSSGTAALHLALILVGVQAGDEVICQSMTFSASANPIVYQGATPVFVDSEEDTWNMSPEFLEQAIKDRILKGNKPKAVILVHLYGMPAKIDEIVEICHRYQIPLIEDAAEALGSTYKGRALGTFGEMSILSFNGNKIITTSGGGALVSKNEEFIRKARFLATQARDAAPHYQHSHIGYNYRMSNVSAGIGRGQMEVLSLRVQKRRSIFEAYKESLKEIEAIKFPNEPGSEFYSNRWLSAVLVDGDVTNDEIRISLEKENIESRPLWKPMHMQPVFAGTPFYGDGTSERLFNKGLCLPSGSNLSDEELFTIIQAVKHVCNHVAATI
jgi:dTDP-4-amino-4,6-dideoxygalactose transaminase